MIYKHSFKIRLDAIMCNISDVSEAVYDPAVRTVYYFMLNILFSSYSGDNVPFLSQLLTEIERPMTMSRL